MLDSFRFVRDTVVGVADAEQQNAETLEAQRIELMRLCNGSNSPSLDSAAQLLSDLNVLSQHDPLAAAEQLPDLIWLIKKSAEQFDDATRQRREVDNLLQESASLIDQISRTHELAKHTFAERELKIGSTRDGSVPSPSLDHEVESLIAWRSKLQSTVQKGEYGPAAIGLKKWTESAASMLANDRRAIETDESSLRCRRELRGLFDALQAKACNCGCAEEAALVAMGSEIRRLLARRPTPLAEAQALVAKYQEYLL